MHHILDDIVWHFRPLTGVSADFRTIVAGRWDPVGGAFRRSDVEDAAAWVAITHSGAQVVAQISRCAPGAAYRWIECFGSEGMLRLERPDHAQRFATHLVGFRPGRTTA
jgi:hypothetical protein